MGALSTMTAVPSSVSRGAAGLAVFVVVAEGFTRLELVNPAYLPPATTVLGRMGGLVVDGEFLVEVLATLRVCALGLLLATAVAVPLGLVLGSFRMLYRATAAVVELLRPLPAVALIPLAILLFGQGSEMQVILVAYACVWPVLFNTIYGVHDVDPLAKETARSFGFGLPAILARVVLPSAAPFIATGVRIAAAIALIIAVATELLAGAERGIGTVIVDAGSGQRTDVLYAATAVAGVIGVLANSTLEWGERRLFGWHRELRA